MTDPIDSPNSSDSLDSADASDSPDPAACAREYLLSDHRGTVETVLDCADAVAATWDGATADDPADVAGPLRAALDAAGAWDRLPELLVGAARTTGHSPSASPVAAPPYVIATSRGPMLRATLPDGRLVVLLRVFEVERAGVGPRYRRGPTTPERAVHVEFV